MTVCPSCGQENPAGFRLCGMCGTPLTPEPAARELRKTVTAVFADVSGSTELGERLDPEALRRVMTRYFAAMRAPLERHGGTVEKFIGDAVVAVFGIPVVHEDDALRALRAAVDMRDALAELNAELRGELDVQLAARIGVNTGEVVSGDPDTQQSFASGDALNVAARLEEAAQPGEILLGETTFQLVRDAALVEARIVEAKGKAEPLQAYRLLAVAPDTAGRVRAGRAPMVGRQTELRRLRAALEQAEDDRSCQLFTVLGAAGVGKSRLAAEFLDSVRGARVLTGRCRAYGEGVTFWPLAEVLKQAAGLDDSEAPDRARAKLASLVGGEENADVIAHRTAELVGLAEGEASTEEAFWAVRKLVEALARRCPLVLVFDDLHWGEPTFLDLVDYLADWLREAPVLLLCLARQELLDARPGWAGGKLNATTVLLEPLTQSESGLLAEGILGAEDLDAEVASRVAEAADGNPLFVEELVAKLLDEGVLEQRNGGWRATRELTELDVPPTVTALLAARLDGLASTEREVLEAAAVEGKVFHAGAVAALAPAPLRDRVPSELMNLLRKELVRPDRAAFADEDAFRFRHLIIRDVAYESLPKHQRAELHERFAAWLEQKAGGRIAEYDEIVGFHLEQAHRYLVELGLGRARGDDLARAAARHLIDSGRRASGRGDLPAAVKLLERGSALLPTEDPARIDAQIELGATLTASGALAQADSVLSAALTGAKHAGDERLEAHASLRRQQLFVQTQPGLDERETRLEAELLITVFERLGDATGVVSASQELGKLLMWLGHCEESIAAFEQAVSRAEQAGIVLERERSLGWLAWPLSSGPTPAPEALRRCREIEIALQGRASLDEEVLAPVALMLAMLGEIDEARSYVQAGRAVLHERGLMLTWGGTSAVAATVELYAGDPVAAEREARPGYDVLSEMGEKGFLATVVGDLAESVFLQGRLDEALTLASVGEEASGRWDVEAQSHCREIRARVLVRRGQVVEAEQLARESRTLLASTDYLPRQAHSCVALADVLSVAGRPSEARPVLEEGLALYERKGDVVYAEKTRAAIAALR